MSIFAGEILWNISIAKEREALPGLDKPGAAMFFGEKSLFCWWLIPRNGWWWPFFLFKRDHYCWWLTQFFAGHWIVLFVGHPQLFWLKSLLPSLFTVYSCGLMMHWQCLNLNHSRTVHWALHIHVHPCSTSLMFSDLIGETLDIVYSICNGDM